MSFEYSVLDGNLTSIIHSDDVEHDMSEILNITNNMINQMYEIIHLHDMGVDIFSDTKGNKIKYADVIYPMCGEIGDIISYIKQYHDQVEDKQSVDVVDSKYSLLKHIISYSVL